MTHRCAAPGCDKAIPSRQTMCKAHWFALPSAMRLAITDSNRPGRGSSRAFRKAVAAARAYLEEIRPKPPAPPANPWWTERNA